MNLDFALVNRALLNLNMDPLEENDRVSQSKEWQTAKVFFLQTMLEALAQVAWTSAKRRRELSPAQTRVKRHAGFAYVFELPFDCAKPLELDAHEYFEVEAGLLYTSVSPARLLYVSNGRSFSQQEVISGGGASRLPSDVYVWGGDARRGRRIEWGDTTISGGSVMIQDAWLDKTGAGKKAPSPLGDYPEYRELRLEPNFFLYWEYLLTSKYARRLTDQPALADVWLQKALAIGRAAEAVSADASAANRKSEDTWQEKLGLK